MFHVAYEIKAGVSGMWLVIGFMALALYVLCHSMDRRHGKPGTESYRLGRWPNALVLLLALGALVMWLTT